MDLFILENIFIYQKITYYEKTLFKNTITLYLQDTQASIKHKNLLLRTISSLNIIGH